MVDQPGGRRVLSAFFFSYSRDDAPCEKQKTRPPAGETLVEHLAFEVGAVHVH